MNANHLRGLVPPIVVPPSTIVPQPHRVLPSGRVGVPKVPGIGDAFDHRRAVAPGLLVPAVELLIDVVGRGHPHLLRGQGHDGERGVGVGGGQGNAGGDIGQQCLLRGAVGVGGHEGQRAVVIIGRNEGRIDEIAVVGVLLIRAQRGAEEGEGSGVNGALQDAWMETSVRLEIQQEKDTFRCAFSSLLGISKILECWYSGAAQPLTLCWPMAANWVAEEMALAELLALASGNSCMVSTRLALSPVMSIAAAGRQGSDRYAGLGVVNSAGHTAGDGTEQKATWSAELYSNPHFVVSYCLQSSQLWQGLSVVELRHVCWPPLVDEQHCRQRQPHLLSGVFNALLISSWSTYRSTQKKTGVRMMKILVHTERRCWEAFFLKRALACMRRVACRGRRRDKVSPLGRAQVA